MILDTGLHFWAPSCPIIIMSGSNSVHKANWFKRKCWHHLPYTMNIKATRLTNN